MNPMAYCGILCVECPTFKATKANDDALRVKTAREWSQAFGRTIEPQDINCDGCSSDGGRLFGHCLACEIRRCAREKGLSTCAPCADYACSHLAGLHSQVPAAREALEALRAKM
jgi:hypothetical protein